MQLEDESAGQSEQSLVEEISAEASNERISGTTVVRAFDAGSGKGLEILKMTDAGHTIEIWVKTK
jgi:hypothetical protein